MPREYRLCGCLLAALIFFNVILTFSVFAAETIIYSEGFEADNGGYSVDGNAQWEWGIPATGPAFANSGQKCWGTFPATTVGTLEGNLYSPSLTIPPLGANQLALISFYAYIDIYYERIRTEGDIYISADGMQTWQLLARLYDEMAGGWQRYQFNVSEYAGKNVNLRFRAYKTDTVPGLFIDDVVLAIDDLPSPATLLTLEANEETAAGASCPWVYPWDGTEFVRDNDIYSVARYPQGEMRDYYLLQKPLVAQENRYTVEIREVEVEDSWTDLLGLLAVDHPPDVAVAPDNHGKVLAYTPAELVTPVSAFNSAGSDVLPAVRAKDDNGFQAYSDDTIDLDFGSADVSTGSRILLRVKGFIDGEGDVKSFTGPPAILVQVRDYQGELQEIGRLNPRFEWSEGVFDLSPYLPDPSGQLRIRLTAISHDVKYHEIDFVALATGPPPAVTVTELPMLTATFGVTDVLPALSASDNDYVQLTSGNKFTVAFTATPQLPGLTRDFILVSEGYYVPKSSTYFIYTWNGSRWLQRDSHSFNTTDSVKVFNLSSYLPDPAGEYKARIWQDYSNYGAGIDYAGLQIGAVTGFLSAALDLRDKSSIFELVRDSDDRRLTYVRDIVTSLPRNRWSEYRWTTVPPEIFTLSFQTDANGSLSGNTSQSVPSGKNSTAVTGLPDSGYHFVNWTAPGGFVSTNNPFIVFNVTADQTFTANFASNPVNGVCGSSNTATFTVVPAINLCSTGTASDVTGSGHPWSWSCAGANGGTTANCAATIQSWSVTPFSGNNGTLSPATPQSVDHGRTIHFNVTPSNGYQLASVSGCGGVVTGEVYTTGAITDNCTVSATFNVLTPHDGIVIAGGTLPTIADALAVLRHVVGQAPLTANQQIHADVAPLAQDGKPLGNDMVDFADVIIILRRVVDAVSW